MSNEAWEYTTRGRLSGTIKRVARSIPTPKADQVIVEVKAVGLNPVEEQVAQSSDRLLKFLGAVPMGTPFVPCSDYSGVIHSIGSGVKGWKVGDEVFGVKIEGFDGEGTLQSYVPITASASIAPKLPSLSWADAAALPLVYSTVYTALVHYGKLPFDPSAVDRDKRSVLILGGSSGTGSCAIQLAKKMGLRVVTTCSGRNVDLVKRLGADEVIDYTKEHIPEKALHSVHAPYAVVLDCVGGKELIPYLDHLLLRDPRAPELGIYVTIVGDSTAISLRLRRYLRLETGRDAMGGAVTNWYYPSQAIRTFRGLLTDYIPAFVPLKSLLAGPRYACIILQPTREILETVPAFMSSAKEVLIDETFPFPRAPEAFSRLESGRARGKVVITF